MSLESEKASMDVPSDRDGVVEKILVKPGDTVQKGPLYGNSERSRRTI